MGVIVQPKIRVDIYAAAAPADAGYYVYGTPGDGAAQFTAPKLLSLLRGRALNGNPSMIENSGSGISAFQTARNSATLHTQAVWRSMSCLA
jgi:hypothetical protein